MSDRDDAERLLAPPYGALDASGMTARIEGIPEQIEQALEGVARAPWRVPGGGFSGLAVGAMGGSAIGAELTAGLYRDGLRAPIVAVRDYAWPGHVQPGWLALLASYSGHTEETLALYDEARRRGVACIALTTGGELGRRCDADGVFRAGLPAGSPPRAAMFASWVRLTALLHALGWAGDPAPAWRAVAARLRSRNATLASTVAEPSNPAKRLARRIRGRSVLVYAGGRHTAPVAVRIRQQLNENAKVFAHSAFIPELNHNEIVSWEHPGAALQGAAVLLVRDAEDSAEARARLDLTAEYVAGQGADVHELSAAAGDRLGRMSELVQLGDYVSLYLALLNGVDPTPIASIDAFKQKLAARSASRKV